VGLRLAPKTSSYQTPNVFSSGAIKEKVIYGFKAITEATHHIP